MSKKIDLELLSKERENIFDDYYNIIEAVKLQDIKRHNDEANNYDPLTKSLTILERNIDDLAIGKRFTSKEFEKIIEIVNASLKEWFPIFELLVQQPTFIVSFSYNLQGLAILIANSEKNSILDFHKDSIFFSPSRKDRLEYEKKKNEPTHRNTSFMDWGSNQSTSQITFKGKISLFDDVHIPEITSKELMALTKDEDLNLEQLQERIDQLNGMLAKMEALGQKYMQAIPSNIRSFRQTEDVLILAKQIYENYEKQIFSIINIKEFNAIENGDIEKYRGKINAFDIHSVLQKIKLNTNYIYEWDIEVLVQGETFSSSQIGFLMWSISSALESIDGVTVHLENWGNGSKFFNLKVRLENILAREEVKQVLDKGRKAAESHYLDRPIEEVEKIKAEKEKTIKETDNLLTKAQAEQLHDIEVERQQIELEDKKLELELKKIQLIRGYSELIKEGILMNDSNFQIKINEVLYVKKEPQLTLGENIEIIAEKEIKKDKNNPE